MNYDVVFSTVRPNLRRFGVIYKPDVNLIVSTGFTVLKPIYPNVCGELIYLHLTSSEILESLHARAEMSVSTYPSITSDDLLEIKIAIPQKPELSQISKNLNSMNIWSESLKRRKRYYKSYQFFCFQNLPQLKTKPMSTQSVEITSAGIKKALQKHTPERAIAEYIWNGFDSKATVIKVDFDIDSTEFNTFKKIRISDNGEGIIYEDLSERFRKFYESNKTSLNSNNSDLTRGKNEYGRFTFYKFARFANWNTSYLKNNNELKSYNIVINSDNLRDYDPSTPIATKGTTGTIVEFSELIPEISTTFINDVLKPYLRAEFAWYLELREEHKLIINGQELDYTSSIEEVDNFPIEIELKNEIP